MDWVFKGIECSTHPIRLRRSRHSRHSRRAKGGLIAGGILARRQAVRRRWHRSGCLGANWRWSGSGESAAGTCGVSTSYGKFFVRCSAHSSSPAASPTREDRTRGRANGPLPRGEGGPLPALSPAGAGRVRGPSAPSRRRKWRLAQRIAAATLASAHRGTPHPRLRRTLSPWERAPSPLGRGRLSSFWPRPKHKELSERLGAGSTRLRA